MRSRRLREGVRALVIGSIIAALLASSLPSAAGLESGQRRLFLAGDSWALFLGLVAPGGLSAADLDHVDVSNTGTPGETSASYLSSQSAAVARDVASCDGLAVDPHPVVVLSLGGNDIVNAGVAEPDGLSGAELASLLDTEVVPNLEEAVAQLVGAIDEAAATCTGLREEPSATIVLTDYDVLNFGSDSPGPDCAGFAYSIIGQTLSTTPPTQPIPAEGNRFMRELAARYSALAAGRAEVTAADLQGSLQGSPGAPDVDRWSPPALLTDLDCIHANAAGFATYFEALLGVIGPLLTLPEVEAETAAGRLDEQPPAAPATPVAAQPAFTG